VKKSTIAVALVALTALTALGGCTSLRRAAGSEKVAPDEFRVVSKAPLVVPPEFNLRPPRPGEARPMELRPDLQARTAVFGVQLGASASEGEKLLIARAGGTNADPRIRAVIDEETGSVARRPEGFADRLLGRAGRPAATDPVQAEAEAERLRAEQNSINNATGGQRATIQQNRPRGFKLPGM
jgi:hypothetical protein